MLTADHCLTQEVCQAFTTMTNPDVLAAILDPSPTHHWQQLLQQHDGPALQAFLALGTASTGLKYAGNLLCEALPNRYFCNNPGCRNVAGVSAGFALVQEQSRQWAPGHAVLVGLVSLFCTCAVL
jgi:hypothetical protein